jgi:hypothetical protein
MSKQEVRVSPRRTKSAEGRRARGEKERKSDCFVGFRDRWLSLICSRRRRWKLGGERRRIEQRLVRRGLAVAALRVLGPAGEWHRGRGWAVWWTVRIRRPLN